MEATLESANVSPEHVDFIMMGNSLGAGLGQNPARIAGVKAGIPSTTGGFTVDHVCASSLTSIILGAQKILSERSEIVLTGGMESMSRARITLPPHIRSGPRFNPNSPDAFSTEDLLVKDALYDVPGEKVMGKEAEHTAREYGVTREAADQFAYRSHMKASEATEAKAFRDEIVPIKKNGETILQKDEGIRPDTDKETLAGLPAVFKKDGIITAGNASQLSDGASTVLLMSEEKANELGVEPIAEIVDWDTTFIDTEEFIRAPVPSVNQLLEQTNKDVDDIGLWEHNEAFACASVLVKEELEIPSSRLNVRGGAVALGHPIGASGARILTTLVHTMKDKGEDSGIATICHGGGGAVSMLVKR